MKQKKDLFALFLILVFVGCGGTTPEPTDASKDPPRLPGAVMTASGVIDAGGLLESVTYLGGDEPEGRGPGSAGDRLAREYLAQRLERLGLEPAFEGNSWDQPFEILGIESLMPDEWAFRGEQGEVSFRFKDEYMGATGVQQPSVSIDAAEVVFVGYGIQAPEEQWDDFKDTDLSGKILLMLNDDPDWDPELFGGERKLYYGRWMYKYESAGRQGAAGAIIVHTAPSAGYPWQVVKSSWNGEQFDLAAGDELQAAVHAWLTEDAAGRLVKLGGHDLSELIASARSREFRPVPLGVTTSLRFDVRIRKTETANTAGVLRGSDPDLADQYVIFSAHHDHFGIGEPNASGDAIYNGALDNGVAMAQVLEIAEAFASLDEAPRRSLMFLFPAAEEQGILGSKFFAESGVLAPGKIAANINLELGNVWGTTEDVVVFGKGKNTLEDDLVELARLQDRVVRADDDPRAGWYYRSDQFRLARVGVPAIWFRSGTRFRGRPEGWGKERFQEWISTHYHQPTDEVSPDWNYDGLVEDARLAFWLGSVVANQQGLPNWYAGDEFEEIREASLEGL